MKNSCHKFDDNCNKCNKTTIKKGIVKYSCEFITHDVKLSKCIKKKKDIQKKYSGYFKGKQCNTKSFYAEKIINDIPNIDKSQSRSDLLRYLNGNKIIFKINGKEYDNKILKNEKSFLKEIPNKNIYLMLQMLISPGFHNDSTVETFNNENLSKYIYNTNKGSKYIMCNTEIGEIDISINVLNNNYELIITNFLVGSLSCFNGQELLKRNVKNIMVITKWDEKTNKIKIIYTKYKNKTT